MRLLVLLVAVLGAFVLVAMLVAPNQPTLRDWYLNNACPLLDRLSSESVRQSGEPPEAKPRLCLSVPKRQASGALVQT